MEQRGEKNGAEYYALELNGIKSIDGLKLKPDHVLIEVVRKPSSIIVLNNANSANSGNVKWEIVKVGERVKDFAVGDIVLDINYNGLLKFYSKGEKNYVLTDQFTLVLATTSDNLNKEE